MAFSRSLLIKGLAGGLGACTACAGGVGIYKYSTSEDNLENLTDKQLIEKAGLSCGLGESDSLGDSETKDCSVKDSGKINVKKGDQKEKEVSFTTNGGSSGAKLKVSRSTEGGYSKNLKFVVDSGDISLTKTEAGSSSSISTKLGQYETYEIKKEDGKYYLSLKDSVEKAKTKILVLPDSCTLPANEGSTASCTLSEGEIKKVKFNGQSNGVTVTASGNTSLTITKTKDTATFTDGYRFTFTPTNDLTINGKTVKANTPTDFKIKKGDGNALTLEKAWGEENEFAKKVGLSCDSSSDNVCSLTTPGGTINIKVADKEKEGITSLNSGGKIKLEKDQAGYNQGFKFTITSGDITPANGTPEESIKLEQYETYEITEKEGKYFLTRKTEAKEEKERALGIFGKCEFPASGDNDCSFTTEEIKKVKFDGQSSGVEVTEGSVSLRITKTVDNSFTDSLRFTFTFPGDVTINSKSVKAKTPTDFKIKKESSNNTLSLEKAWSDDNAFANKVGLSCDSGSNECSVNSSGTPSTLSVKIGEKKKENITSISTGSGTSGKIKLEKEQEGYNQGLKFTVSEGDVTLTVTGESSSDNKLEELETYEITEDGGKYYLTRKTTKEDAIKKSLSIPGDCFTATPESNSCSPLKTTDLSKINFESKGEGMARVENNGRANLTISKVTNTTDFPLGYRFTFLTTGEMTITETNKVKANIPTEFKIKKGGSNALTLEKAWSNDGNDLITKVGLENCSTAGTNGCDIKTTGTNTGLNVKQGETAYESKAKSSTPAGGKIKLYKEQEGYLEGLKFVIEENDITLGNGSPNIKLTQYETYGIEEKNGKYYLSRKTDGKGEKIKKLGLPDHCEWEESSPSSSAATSQICSITQQALKDVKFKNKKSDFQGLTGSENITVMFDEVKEEEASTHPLGLKVSFISNSTSDINIPLNGSSEGGAIVLKKNIKKEFKITKETDGGLSLERAFDIDSFVKDAGLEKCYDNLGCSLKDKLNVWLDGSNYRVEAKVSGSKEHKVTYEEKISGGYEFTINGNITFESVSAADGTSSKGNVTTLNKGDKFQIKKHRVNNTDKCFLSKITS